jgi:hypothetical protein
MIPVMRAKALHYNENGPRSFREDLEAHLIHGIVFSTPTAFIMARYVSRSWPAESILNPWLNDATCSQLDTLHVYLAAGDLTEFFTFPHKPVTWLSFERKNTLKFYDYARLRRTILHT